MQSRAIRNIAAFDDPTKYQIYHSCSNTFIYLDLSAVTRSEKQE